MSEPTILKSKIPPKFAGQPLIDYVSNRFRYQTRETWVQKILDGTLSLNDQKVPPEIILQKGDQIAYSVILNEPPVRKNIQIIYEEDGFLVAVKPGLLPSHADGNFIKNTFIYLINEKLRSAGWKGTAHLTHRLDRETSGLMIVAKDRPSLRNITQQFEQGLVEKEYCAIVQKVIEQDQFEINGAIGPDHSSQISIRFAVVPVDSTQAKSAATRFKVLNRWDEATLVSCVPLTGRTSQIRVHLASIGHPLVHDKLYGRTDEEFLSFIAKSKRGEYEKDIENAPRHLLHAAKLVFNHPQSGKKMTFESEMPIDMKSFIESQKTLH
jgi:RluA family pseudouridine synthase